jgi:hypothetical protein
VRSRGRKNGIAKKLSSLQILPAQVSPPFKKGFVMIAPVDLNTSARLFGLPSRTIDQWVRQGLAPLCSSSQSRGRGSNRKVDIVGLLAIGVVKTLRKQGATVDAIRPIGDFFCATDFNRLYGEIRLKPILMSGGGQTCLVSRTATIKNSNPDGELLILVDLEVASERLLGGLLASGLLKASTADSATPAGPSVDPVTIPSIN